jgi:hypothetical protein
MKILSPTTITESMLGAATTVTEPAAGETAWASGGAYTVGDVRIRASTHRAYRCAVAHTGSAIPPEADAACWVDAGPTARWAPFDIYTSTAATATTSMSFVINPGFFNGLALYGLVGVTVRVLIKSAPGGTALLDKDFDLFQGPSGWYEYLFTPARIINKLLVKDLPISPTAELTITITAAVGQPVAVGMIIVGDYRPLVGEDAEYGGTQYGVSVEPVTYSYISTDEYGDTKIIRRHKATGLRANVILPRANADAALEKIQDMLDIPVSWVAVDAQGFDGLNVFGLGTAKVSYDGPNLANIDISVKGLI